MTTQFNRASVLRFYFNLLMVVVYAAMGLSIALRLVVPDLARPNRIAVATTLLLYAAYRAVKTFRLRRPEPTNTPME